MKKLTFSQLCPLWYKKFKQDEFFYESEIDGKQLNIHNFPNCAVGEAHNFSDEYIDESNQERHFQDVKGKNPCATCTDFSYKFSNICEEIEEKTEYIEENDNIEYHLNQLKHAKADFVKHWKKVHVK